MARPIYDLKVYKTANFKSMNGTSYSVKIWWDGVTGNDDMNLGGEGIQISYENDAQFGKNSPIMTSKCTIPLVVANFGDEIWIDVLREDMEERQVWLTIEEDSQAAADIPYLWCGYFILDLSSREDVSFPYVTTLTAVDGLASLKDKPFVIETNPDTGVAPVFPYVKNDTFIPTGFKKIINSNASWIKVLLDNVGQLIATDSTDPSITLKNYVIQTSVNWYHEDMPQTGDDWLTYDPLEYIRLNMSNLYEENDDGFYSVPTCYSVLEYICRTFNMRVSYWNHTFNFTQIDMYNVSEEGTNPILPINIPTREYYYNGGTRTDRNYIGNKTTTLYNMPLENITTPSLGLLKLAGGIYNGLPAISEVHSMYMERAGQNYYNGFPAFPASWGTSTTPVQFTEVPLDALGNEKSIIFNNADELAGFTIRIPLSFTNTSTQDVQVETAWSIRAKPIDSAWGDADNKTLRKISTAVVHLEWKNYEFPLYNNQEYILNYTSVVGSSQGGNDNLLIFDSSVDSITNFTNNLVPTHSDFIGDWEFQFFTFSEYDSDSTYPMRATTEIADFSHGRVTYIAGAGTNYDGTAMALERVPTSYALNYSDVLDLTQNPPYEGLFVPIESASATSTGTFAVKTISTANNLNSYIYNVGQLIWGDGSGANSKSTMQVYDGTNWIYVNPLGKWNKATITWNAGTSSYDYVVSSYDKKIVNLLNEQILNNQSINLLKFGMTTALSVNEKYYSGTTRLKFFNPIARMKDTDGKKYIILRGTFNMNMDEWTGEFHQIKYEVPPAWSSASTTISNVAVLQDTGTGGGFTNTSTNGVGSGMWTP